MLSEKVVSDIARLAARLRVAKDIGQPYALYLGTGLARSTGNRPFVEVLRECVLRADIGGALNPAQLASLLPEDRERLFNEYWLQLNPHFQRQLIQQAQRDLQPVAGYQQLAALIAQGYFRPVMTSNIDGVLVRALQKTEVEISRAINGVHNEQSIRTALLSTGSAVTLLSLCGDLEIGWDRSFVTLPQLQHEISKLKSCLDPFISHDVIVLGYEYLDDQLIGWLPKARHLYFVGENLPVGDWNFFQQYPQAQRQDIVAPGLSFELFCWQLAQTLDGGGRIPPPPSHSIPQPGEPDSSLVELSLVELIDRDSETPLFEEIKHSVFTLRVDREKRLSFSVSGKTSYESPRAVPWNVDIEASNEAVQQLGNSLLTPQGEDWRATAKREGRQLYESLLDRHRELAERFAAARAMLSPQEVLTLRFVGPRDHLGLPYELLHDGSEPLIVQYPLCRQVSGVTPTHGELLNSTIIRLRQKRRPFRVLLVASDTHGNLTVDAEIGRLKSLLQNRWRQAPKLEIDTLTTGEASASELQKRLERCKYHLVHFAGHGVFDPFNPEQSGLLVFKERRRKNQEVSLLSARQLSQWLRGSEVRLFYLNCCVAAASGHQAHLRSNDYLAVMDALVQAGIPYVFGYRWYVTDHGSRLCAEQFYTSLLDSEYGLYVPEYAVWEARRKLYGENAFDETWASPVLIAQQSLAVN